MRKGTVFVKNGNPQEVRSIVPFTLAVIAGWLLLFHFISTRTWGYGASTFVIMMGVVTLVVFGALCRGRLPPARGSAWYAVVGTIILVALVVWMCSELLAALAIDQPGSASDIARNTLAAGDHLVDGRNPYAERAQLLQPMVGSPGIEMANGKVWLYGIPYDYGYPYFPVMFLAYVPFRPLVHGIGGIRFGNAFWTLTALAGVLVLVRRLVRDGDARALSWWAGVAFLGLPVLGKELLEYAVTDVLIAAISIWAFIALDAKRDLLSGLLFGLAQGCKLFPGPFLLLPALLWLGKSRRSLRVSIGFIVMTVATVVPWIAWDWRRFLSSTILFYLTRHQEGDDTALYYFLPPSFQTFHLALGGALTLLMLLLVLRGDRSDILEPLRAAFLSYMVFSAFNRMTHFNYVWGIYSLGCVCIVVTAARTKRIGVEPVIHSA